MTFLLGRWLRSRPSNPNTPPPSDPPTVPPIKIDEFHKHEVIDRAHVIRSMWFEHINDHPAVTADPDIAKAAARVGDSLEAFYQLCGEKFL